MIGAVQSRVNTMEPVSMARAASPVASPQPAESPSSPELTQQVLDVMESQNATAEAMLQAEVSIFRESLEIGQQMAGAMLQMLDPTQAFQAGGGPVASSGSNLSIQA